MPDVYRKDLADGSPALVSADALPGNAIGNAIWEGASADGNLISDYAVGAVSYLRNVAAGTTTTLVAGIQSSYCRPERRREHAHVPRLQLAAAQRRAQHRCREHRRRDDHGTGRESRLQRDHHLPRRALHRDRRLRPWRAPSQRLPHRPHRSDTVERIHRLRRRRCRRRHRHGSGRQRHWRLPRHDRRTSRHGRSVRAGCRDRLRDQRRARSGWREGQNRPVRRRRVVLWRGIRGLDRTRDERCTHLRIPTARVVSGQVDITAGDATVSIPAGVTGKVTDNGNGGFGIQNLGGGDLTITGADVHRHEPPCEHVDNRSARRRHPFPRRSRRPSPARSAPTAGTAETSLSAGSWTEERRRSRPRRAARRARSRPTHRAGVHVLGDEWRRHDDAIGDGQARRDPAERRLRRTRGCVHRGSDRQLRMCDVRRGLGRRVAVLRRDGARVELPAGPRHAHEHGHGSGRQQPQRDNDVQRDGHGREPLQPHEAIRAGICEVHRRHEVAEGRSRCGGRRRLWCGERGQAEHDRQAEGAPDRDLPGDRAAARVTRMAHGRTGHDARSTGRRRSYAWTGLVRPLGLARRRGGI